MSELRRFKAYLVDFFSKKVRTDVTFSFAYGTY